MQYNEAKAKVDDTVRGGIHKVLQLQHLLLAQANYHAEDSQRIVELFFSTGDLWLGGKERLEEKVRKRFEEEGDVDTVSTLACLFRSRKLEERSF